MIASQAFLIPLLLLAALPGGRARAADGLPPREHREALGKLAAAAQELDVDAYATACAVLLKGDGPREVKAVVESYGTLAERAMKDLEPGEFLRLHGRVASTFRAVTSDKALLEMEKLRTKHREWQGRLLLLDASGFNEKSSLLDSALAALADEHPIVIRRALHYLSRAKERRVVEAIVARYLKLSGVKAKRPDASQHERTLLACRSALHQLLGVDLPAPEDYRNYIEGRKDDPDLFEPRRGGEDEATEVTLFGAAVSGKNIAFILDVSGSMLTTDPEPPPEGLAKEDRRTVVAGAPGADPAAPRIREERRRIVRAKSELAKVIRALPEDVQFNLILYSSRVSPWQGSMVAASAANKKDALAFIEEARAEGITVTDEAIEEAFRDLALDTIYLITDGAPTHTNSQGPGLPEDAPRIIAAIHKRVEEVNFLRGVRIFTLGFRGAEEEFLKKLAADHAGSYVAIR